LPFIESVSKIKLINNSLSYDSILRRYVAMNRTVSQEPWQMILWNPLTNKMIMRNQSLVKYLLINMYDTTLLSQREKQEMKSKFATIFNITHKEAELRINSYVI
jgi:DNA sulfur modification protein DndB